MKLADEDSTTTTFHVAVGARYATSISDYSNYYYSSSSLIVLRLEFYTCYKLVG